MFYVQAATSQGEYTVTSDQKARLTQGQCDENHPICERKFPSYALRFGTF
jgi:hypothetical protein